MDFEIGNILYIVITLVAVIVGILGKKKKPANQGTGEEEGAARPGFMENLERVLRMGQENPQVSDLQSFDEDISVEEEYVTEQGVTSQWEPMKAPSIMDNYDRIMKGSSQGDSDLYFTDGENMSESPELIDLDRYPGTSLSDLTKNFDARTAVIYATIINRLDY